MKIVLKTLIAGIVLFLSYAPCSNAARKGKLESIALSYVKDNYKSARKSTLFASQTHQVKLIGKHSVIKVSTADTIPFMNWYVVIDNSGKAKVLSHKNLKEFNGFIKKEALQLKTNSDFYRFIETFTVLACESETLATSSDITDRNNLRSEFKKLRIKIGIKTGRKGLVLLTFYTANTTRTVKMWRLTVNRKGYILKIKKAIVTVD